MGTYKSIRIMVDTQDPDERQGIWDILRAHQATDCWFRFSEQTKWWPDELMKELTSKYPNVMFRVDLDGGCADTTYYLGNVNIGSYWVMPTFPSRAKIKSDLKKRAKYEAEEKAKKEAAEATKKAEEAARAEAAERAKFEELKLKFGA